MWIQGDVSGVLGAVQVPTLVLHRVGDRFLRLEHGRHLAAHMPGAKYVELPAMASWPPSATGEALRCEANILALSTDIGPELRAGVHTGEVEVQGDDKAGLAVTIAKRVRPGRPRP